MRVTGIVEGSSGDPEKITIEMDAAEAALITLSLAESSSLVDKAMMKNGDILGDKIYNFFILDVFDSLWRPGYTVEDYLQEHRLTPLPEDVEAYSFHRLGNPEAP